MLCKLIRIVFFFVNWLILIFIVIFYVEFVIIIILIDLCVFARPQNVIHLLNVNVNKNIISDMKSLIFF